MLTASLSKLQILSNEKTSRQNLKSGFIIKNNTFKGIHMVQFNYKVKRNMLFEFISSIELDMREFVSSNHLSLLDLLEKTEKRVFDHFGKTDENLFEREKYNFLDFCDYTHLINIYFKKNDLSDSHYKELVKNLEVLAPIRNRVMHSRPLLADDDIKVLDFVKNYKNFNSIICFDNLLNSEKLIDEKPNLFFDKTPTFNTLYIHQPIEHNLPMVDYDDTGFVGREEAKKQLIKKLYSAHSIISVVGDGGIGKTSTVLSCIYDIMDENNFQFEKVIWISLKTKALLDGEFKELKNSFSSFNACIEQNDILKREGTTTIESLLFYMTAYKTLLILDNLETINSEDIKNLFEDLPHGSKIIITSRIGIREYESRLVLTHFNVNEAAFYFRKLVKVYGVKVLEGINDEEVNKYIARLYFSPLCIKWFVINVGKGHNPDIIVNTQDELIEFCLSNVYDKLSESAKHIIQILLVKQLPCSIAEIVFLNKSNYSNSVESINELCACNFLEQVGYGIYIVPEFAKKYLNTKIVNNEQLKDIRQTNNKLVGMIENLQADIHLKDKNHPLSFFPKNNSEKIATIYMLKFIEASKQNNFDNMEQFYDAATKASPKFPDIYKVAAYLYGKINQSSKAVENYLLAIECSENQDDKAYIKSLYASYLINMQINFDEARQLILEAIQQIPDNPYFHSNYARLLKFEKKFDDALEKISEILSASYEIPEPVKKQLFSEYADVSIRKIDFVSDESQKQHILDSVLKYIDGISCDYFSVQLYKTFSKILKNMLFLNDRRPIKKKIKDFVAKYLPYILFVEYNNPDFKYSIEKLNSILDDKINLDNFCCQFAKEEIGTIEKVFDEKGFGFISLRKWYHGCFFHYSQIETNGTRPQVGEKASFIPYYKNGKWTAVSINLIDSNDDEDN